MGETGGSARRRRTVEAAPRAEPARHRVLPDLGDGRRRHDRRDRRRRAPGLHLAARALPPLLRALGARHRRDGGGAARRGRPVRLGPPGLREVRRGTDLAALLGRDADVARRLVDRRRHRRLGAVRQRPERRFGLRVRGRVRPAGDGGERRTTALGQVGAVERRDRADRPARLLHRHPAPVRRGARRPRHVGRRPPAVVPRVHRGRAGAALLVRRHRAARDGGRGDGRPEA